MNLRTLIIMRHAKSDWGEAQLTDHERPLAARGRRDAVKMARWLGDQEFAPSAIKCSSALRAIETSVAVANELGGLPIIREDRLYLADLNELLAAVRRPVSACWLLVGHNPGLESLVRYFDPDIERRSRHRKLLPTAAIYAFNINGERERLAPGCGSLVCHQRPKLIT